MHTTDRQFHLRAGGAIVSTYLVDGPCGKAGDEVAYYQWEVEGAKRALGDVEAVARILDSN